MGVAGILWTLHVRLACAVLTLTAGMLIIIFLGIGIVHEPEEKKEDPEQ